MGEGKPIFQAQRLKWDGYYALQSSARGRSRRVQQGREGKRIQEGKSRLLIQYSLYDSKPSFLRVSGWAPGWDAAPPWRWLPYLIARHPGQLQLKISFLGALTTTLFSSFLAQHASHRVSSPIPQFPHTIDTMIMTLLICQSTEFSVMTQNKLRRRLMMRHSSISFIAAILGALANHHLQ